MPAEHAQQVELAAREIQEWLHALPVERRCQALGEAADAHGAARRTDETEGRNRNRGTWYTPPALVESVLDAALEGVDLRRACVCDPACGSGHFLVQSARRMIAAGRVPTEVPSAIAGCDIDPRAVALARARLALETGTQPADWRDSVWCGDALAKDAWTRPGWRAAADGRGGGARIGLDVVVGNPPFLNQVRRRSAATRKEAAALHARFDGAVAGLADVACAFLLLAQELAWPQGRVALVLPMSLLASADAAPARRAFARTVALTRCMVPPTRVFGGGVPTVVLVADGRGVEGRAIVDEAVRCSAAPCVVQRILTAGRHSSAGVPQCELAGDSWSPLLAALRGVPRVPQAGVSPLGVPPLARAATIAAIARATADFRQHYYGIRGLVREWRRGGDAPGPVSAPPSESAPEPRAGECPAMPCPQSDGTCAVATVGSIDRAECTWGRRPVRLHGAAFEAPVVDVATLRQDAMLGRWASERLVPKVIVATQTRTIEAWVDAHGAVLPSTPLISVQPISMEDLWRVAAALLAPATAATAWWRHAGAALSASALKLSARQLLALPLPTQRAAWDEGADRLRAWHAAPQDAAHASRFAEHMNDAFAVTGAQTRDALTNWWLRGVTMETPSRRRPVFC